MPRFLGFLKTRYDQTQQEVVVFRYRMGRVPKQYRALSLLAAAGFVLFVVADYFFSPTNDMIVTWLAIACGLLSIVSWFASKHRMEDERDRYRQRRVREYNEVAPEWANISYRITPQLRRSLARREACRKENQARKRFPDLVLDGVREYRP